MTSSIFAGPSGPNKIEWSTSSCPGPICNRQFCNCHLPILLHTHARTLPDLLSVCECGVTRRCAPSFLTATPVQRTIGKLTWLVLGGDPAARSFFPTRAQLFGFRWARFRKLGVVLDAMRCAVVVVLMIWMTTAAGGDAGSDYDWCCVL